MARDPENPILAEVNDELKELGRLIKEARLRRDIPLSYLTDQTGVSRRTLTRIEHGVPGVSISSVFAVVAVIKGNEKEFLDVVREPLCKTIEENVRHYPRKRSRAVWR